MDRTPVNTQSSELDRFSLPVLHGAHHSLQRFRYQVDSRLSGSARPCFLAFWLASRFWVFGSIACFFEIKPAQHIFEKPSSR